MIILRRSGGSASDWHCLMNLDQIFTVFLTAVFTFQVYTALTGKKAVTNSSGSFGVREFRIGTQPR